LINSLHIAVEAPTCHNFVGEPEPDNSSSIGMRDKGKSKAPRANIKWAISVEM
jgi:hypothetical protein